ncbi:MAG: glycosyltransferase family 39 protein [Acidobacteriia bacterium]|nr:glycosyltransferase family 39 protein [Terriglobia bacterium]
MKQALYILFGAAFTYAVSLSLGRLLFQKLRLRLYRQEETPLAFVCGSACLSFILFILAASQLLYKGVLLALGVAVLLTAWRMRAFHSDAPSLPGLPRRTLWLYLPVAALFTTLGFLHAMAPEMSPDGSTYHLGLVARYYRERGFSFLTTNMYANLSQGVEMLFLYAYAFGKHSASALVHFSFFLTLPFLILNYARRCGMPTAGMAAALFVFLSPVVAIDGASAYNDVAVAAILFAVFYLVQIWDESRSNALLIPIGMTAGFAFASKYTAFPALVYVAGYLIWRTRALRPLLIVSVCALAMFAPWLIKNAIVAGNPVSPFFNQVFPNPNVHISFEKGYVESMRNYPGLASRWDIPLEVTVRGHLLCGLLGPLFLLAPIALLSLTRQEGRRLLAAGLCFGAVYYTNIGTRFLIPPLPYVALAMAMAFARAPALLAVLVLLHALSAWPPLMKKYCATYAWRLDRLLYKQALRIETEDQFLTRTWPNYAVARMIERLTPPGANVLTFNQTGDAYTTRNIIVAYQSAHGNKLGAIMWTPLISDYQPTRHATFRFPTQPLRAARLRQTAAKTPDHWTVNEVRLYHNSKELPRAPQWRLRASPNPWDVQEAFDNSPVTRWGSWQVAYPGMHIEVEFPAPASLDSVVVETSTDVAATRMELDGQDPSGVWHTIQKEPVITEAPPPLGLRREAAEVLKERGIGFLLVHEDDFAAKDFRNKQDLWGIAHAGDSFGFHLYKIQ